VKGRECIEKEQRKAIDKKGKNIERGSKKDDTKERTKK
jgi:hypothetical protein